MKKILLSLVAVFAVATIANADPRFGVIGHTSGGAGLFVTDDVYSGSLTFGSSDDDASSETKTTDVSLGANYKMGVDSVTSLTVGIGYKTTSGDVAGTTIGTKTSLDLNVGVERALSSNVVLTAETALYSSDTTDETGTEVKTVGILSSAQVGVAYLF